jgi:hypothetical protein
MMNLHVSPLDNPERKASKQPPADRLCENINSSHSIWGVEIRIDHLIVIFLGYYVLSQ